MRLSINVNPPKITKNAVVVDELGPFPSSLLASAKDISGGGRIIIVCSSVKALRKIYNSILGSEIFTGFNILIEININKLFRVK